MSDNDKSDHDPNKLPPKRLVHPARLRRTASRRGPDRLRRNPPRQKHPVPKKGFSAHWIENVMAWPKPGSRNPQLKYYYRIRTGLSLVLVAGANRAATWRCILYDDRGHTGENRMLGRWPSMSCEQARAAAEACFANHDPAAWRQPVVEVPTLNKLLDRYMKERVDKREYRTAYAIGRNFDTFVRPVLGKWPAYGEGAFTLTDLANMLNDIRSDSTADKILGALNKAFQWFATQDHRFKNVLVPGMGRHTGKERERVLTDDEIRKLWAAEGLMRDFYCFALLCAQRKTKILEMTFSDIGADGLWTIKSAPREKDHGKEFRLPALALEIVERQRFEDSEPTDRVFPLSLNAGNFWAQRKELDAALGNVGENAHVVHDLRRTARTRMSELGVLPWVAERVLGHQVGSEVERTYDRYAWIREKSAALQLLADSIAQTVGLNVVPFEKQA
jgi:integrase